LVGRLTLEEKVGLVHANGKFRAGGVERLGVPYLWTADGPQGVREELGVDSWNAAGWTSDFATAMPVGIALASTWNVEPGLSYTRFLYAGLQPQLTVGPDGPSATLSFQLTNTGAREGAEVVQVYVRPVKPPVIRPDKELKAFAKVLLKPGETKTVTLTLGPRAFAFYAPEAKAWQVAKGRYDLLVGASSRNIRLTGSVEVTKAALLK
jgi:Fibronectin type III-like domain